MAGDQFIDPQVQANLNKLVGALSAKQAELTDLLAAAREAVGGLESLSTEAIAADQERARSLSATRTPAVGSIEEATAAIKAEGTAVGDLNAQLIRNIELESQAASARRSAAQGAIGGQVQTPAGQAADRIQAALAAEEQARAQSAQTTLEANIRAAAASLPRRLGPAGSSDAALTDAFATVVGGKIQAAEALAGKRLTDLYAGPGLNPQAAAAQDAALARQRLLASAYAGPGLDPQAAADAQRRSLASQFDLGAVGGPSQQQALAAGQAAAQEAAALEQLATRSTAAAHASDLLGSATQRNILQYTQGDNALQRHGALTVDFLNAAAKGQVTLREFGDQIGATIGKFAGWTGAAAAVYGAYNAVTELSRGAIDASNTVGQLHRTIDGLSNQQAAQAIIQLAHDTNTSMKEAGDAVFAFSRTFHNVGDATYAAGLALRAYQLDGVSVADQVKAQTAIHQQFGVTAKGLGPIYDELAAGQREFNARISDQIPLLQRSASAVKNAGGDLQTFIELSTIALRTTQLSGSQLGTAFLRSASTFLNPATTKGSKDRAVLASLGIDPNQNYTDLIVNALQRSATLSNSQREKLSLAVFGPLLGGRTAGFFTGGASLLGDVQKQLAPAAVKGTFLSEFATEIGTTQQQLKALGNNLQQLGAEFGQSGLGAPIGALVLGMNEVLSVSTKILGVWSQLPAPLKDAAGVAAAAFGLRAVTQRAGLTSAFGQQVPFFGRSQSSIANAQALSGLQAEQQFYQQQYTSTIRQAAVAGTQAQSAAALESVAAANGNEEQANRAQKAYEAAVERRLQLEIEAEALQQQAVASQERLNAVQERINAGQSAQAALAAEGVQYRLNTLDRGSPHANPVVPVGGLPQSTVLLPPGATSGAAALANDVTTETSQIGLWTAAKARIAQQIALENGAMQEADATAVATTSAAEAGAAEQEALAAELPLTTAAMNSLRSAGAALSANLGGLTLAAVGIGFVYSEIKSKLEAAKQADDQLNQTISGLVANPGNLANFQQTSQVILKQMKAVLASQSDAFAGGLDPLGNLDALIAPVKNVTSKIGKNQTITTQSGGVFSLLLQQAQNDAKSVKDTQAGRDQWYRELDTLKQYAVASTADYAKGLSPAAVKLIYASLSAFLNSLQAIYQQAQQGLQTLPVAKTDPFAQFRNLSTDAIVKNIQSTADRIKLYGADTQSLQQLAFAYAYLASKFATSKDDKSLQLVTQAQSLFVEAVRKDAQDLIDQADVATTKGGKLALLHQAAALLDNAKAQMTAADNALKAGVATDQAAYEAALKAQADATLTFSEVAAEGVQFLGAFEANQAVLRAQVQKTAAAYNAAKSALSASQHAIQQVFSQLDQSLKTINTQTAATTKVPKVPSSQDPFELTRLRRELQQARDQGDPVKAAQDAVGLAHDEIAAARNEHERLQGLIDLANAENQLNKAIEDRTQSYYTYLESTTTDPIKQAQISLKAAAEAVQNATKNSGKGTKDYYDAKAKLNDARQKLVDAQVSGKEQDIQFYLDMGDISVQTAIQEYNALLSMHNLTKAQRQRILEDIKKLKDGSASQFGALDLGTIRLPTPYEIRRALLAAQQYGNQALTQQTYSNAPAGAPATLAPAPVPQIHVHVYNASDVPAVGAQLSRYFSGTGKSLQRAAGIRGGG